MATVNEPDTAGRLVEAAIRLLESSGPEALQARKLAVEIGASTMAVYTHFGGMPQLARALASEGFLRLDRRLSLVETTDDPLADLFAQGLAYRAHAMDNPQLYRLMFGLTTLHSRSGAKDLLRDGAPTDLAEGLRAFEHLVGGVRRVAESGRLHLEEDPTAVAAQIWSAIHGYVLLEIAGFFGGDADGVEQVLVPLAVRLAVGFGESEQAAMSSARAALSR